MDRLRRASLAADLDWAEGGAADLGALAVLAAEAGPDGSSDRLVADGQVAWWESRVRLAAMDPDWRRPLGEFRGRLGDAAAGLHVRAMRRRAITVPLLLGLGFVLLGLIGADGAGVVSPGP
jgi:hypothetical protein